MAEDSGDLSLGYMMGQSENNGGFGGLGDGWLGLILFAMIFGGGWGGGFGGGFGGGVGLNGALTRAELYDGFAIQNIDSAVRGVQNGIADSTYALTNSITSGFHGVDSAVCNLGHQISDCCCTTQRAIDGVNYNLATQFCGLGNAMNSGFRDVIDAQRSGTREILDFLVQDKISTLTAENQSLKFAASQTAQNQFITQVGSDIVNRLQPPPVPAYTVPNPYAGYGYSHGSCGCGCGCG